jgi:hypothetical protein
MSTTLLAAWFFNVEASVTDFRLTFINSLLRVEKCSPAD